MSVTAVYDTVVFFQAATRPDRVHATMRGLTEGKVTLFVSGSLMAEIQAVLQRREYTQKFSSLTPDAVRIFIADILSRAAMFEPVPMTFTWPEHPDDDHLFNLAIHANVNYLVTWETRILKLATATSPSAQLLRRMAPTLAIVTPKQFADVLRLPTST